MNINIYLNFSNLKGVGPAFASCVLAAYRPDKVPFMSEEVLYCTVL